MAWRALFAFLILPGVFGFLLPPLIASCDPWQGSEVSAGFMVGVLGVVVLLWCVRDFFVSGRGTLAPWDPPKRLVVVGLYRYMRNPMYIGVLLLVLGWALVLGSPLVACYTVVLAVGFHVRVLTNEEPRLAQQFTSQWQIYSAMVPRWLPRVTPWKNNS